MSGCLPGCFSRDRALSKVETIRNALQGASGSAPAGRHSAHQRTISVLRIVEPFPMTKRQLYADIAARHTPEGIKVVTLAKGALASRYRMPRGIRPAHRADQWTSNSTPAG